MVSSMLLALLSNVTQNVPAGSFDDPVYYYLPVLIVATMPWAFVLASGLLRSMRGVLEGEARHARYLSGALLAGLVLFTLSQGKSPNYLMPLLPIAALLLSWELARQAEAARSRLGATLGLTVMLSLLTIVVARGSARPDWAEFQRPAQLAAAALAVGAVVTLVATLRAQTRLA